MVFLTGSKISTQLGWMMGVRTEKNRNIIEHADEVAALWEKAIDLNGSGIDAIRELRNALANVEQADVAMSLIATKHEHLINSNEHLQRELFQMQRDFSRLVSRVLRLEQEK